MRSVAVFAQDLAVLQAPGLATKVLQHAKRLNVDPEATSPLLELLKPEPGWLMVAADAAGRAPEICRSRTRQRPSDAGRSR